NSNTNNNVELCSVSNQNEYMGLEVKVNFNSVFFYGSKQLNAVEGSLFKPGYGGYKKGNLSIDNKFDLEPDNNGATAVLGKLVAMNLHFPLARADFLKQIVDAWDKGMLEKGYVIEENE